MTWERCPHKYLLEKVAGAPQKPAVYFAGGTAVHLMTEALDTGTAPSGAKFEDYFYPEVSRLMEAHDGLYWDTKQWLMGGSADKPETCEDWLEIGPRCVENWRAWKLTRPVHYRVEVDVTGSLPGCPVPIKAFADRIASGGAGEDIVDIKTGKSKPKDRFQLETYSSLRREVEHGPYVRTHRYFMARTSEAKEYAPTMESREVGERYGKVYAEMVEAAETGDYPYKREFTCKWCPVQDSCLAYSGDTKMAKANDPYYKEGKPPF